MERGKKWIIQDWAGNHLFTDKVFESLKSIDYENIIRIKRKY